MGKWSKSQPAPLANHTDRAANALYFIGLSMMGDFQASDRAVNTRLAAAEVRAWRKSLDGESCRWDATGAGDVRTCLQWAAKCVLWADEGADGLYLRRSEAYLREAARLLDAEDPK